MTTGTRTFVVIALVAGLGASAIAQPAAPAPNKSGAAEKQPASPRKQASEPVVLGPDAPTNMLYVADIGEPTASEGLAPAVIRDTLRASGDSIDDCYADAARKHPGLGGTVELKFRIAKTGAVANASATGVAGASTCIAKVVS